MKARSLSVLIVAMGTITSVIISCSKGGGDSPTNPCSGITIVVSGNSTNPNTPGGANGSISAAATGGSGFTFRLNNGSFQASGNFTNLAAGTYTVTARNSDGCTGTRQFVLSDPTATCAGIVINVAATTTGSIACTTPATGSITANATGSSGITYSINGTSFQASGNFTALAAGTYTVTAKDANGCTGTATVSVTEQPAGALFTSVRTLINNNCVSCHNNAIQNGGMNWAVDCNIVLNKDRVKARAVDNNPSPMPPTGALSQADKDKITAWLNAGGKFSD